MIDIETLHKSGKLPDKYYNQLNGKTATENYIRLKANRNELSADLKSNLYEIIQKSLDDILNNLQF